MDKVNEIKINVPEGIEAYLEDNIIKFRATKKELTYDDIAKELFKDKKTYYTDVFCNIETVDGDDINYNNINNGTSEKQLKKLLAINELMNVAKYLNGDWQPDWNNHEEPKYYICISKYDSMHITYCDNNSLVYFKTEELAIKAIEILGKEIIKLALCTDW